MKKFKGLSVLLAAAIVGHAAHATIDLGAASSFAALALDGNITMSNPVSDITGAVGVAGSGYKFSISGGGAAFNDVVYLHSGSVLQNSTGNPITTFGGGSNTSQDAFLQQAAADAIAASVANACRTPTDVLGNITNSTTITKSAVGNYVINLGDVNLSGGQALTLNAPAGSTFVLNINGKVSLSGGSDILIGGGLTAVDVLYNVLPTGSVQTSGGLDSNGVPKSVITGILLNTSGKVDLAPGLVNGAVIAKEIIISSGGQITAIPEISSLLPLSLVLAGITSVEIIRRRRSSEVVY